MSDLLHFRPCFHHRCYIMLKHLKRSGGGGGNICNISYYYEDFLTFILMIQLRFKITQLRWSVKSHCNRSLPSLQQIITNGETWYTTYKSQVNQRFWIRVNILSKGVITWCLSRYLQFIYFSAWRTRVIG